MKQEVLNLFLRSMVDHQSILQALAEQSRIVRLPLNKIGSINKINKAYAKLEQENERDPSADEAVYGHTMMLENHKKCRKTCL